VTSHTTDTFRRLYSQLPSEIQQSAIQAYNRWRDDPFHPSLQFKQIHKTQPIFSIRVGLHYRALGIRKEDTLVWFWIGSHSDYDGMISRL